MKYHLHNNHQVIRMTSCEPTQTSPCTLKKRAKFSSEEREVYSMEKCGCSNLLKTVLRNKTALTLIITVRLLVGHDSLTQLGSLVLGIWITSFLKNLNINFIGKSVQCKLHHQEGTHATIDHRQVLKTFFKFHAYIYICICRDCQQASATLDSGLSP